MSRRTEVEVSYENFLAAVEVMKRAKKEKEEKMRVHKWWLVIYPVIPHAGLPQVKQVEWMTEAEAEVKARAVGGRLGVQVYEVKVLEEDLLTRGWAEVKGAGA